MSATIDESCIFCKIARGDLGTEFVAETERCLAFRDIDPKAPIHILVIPRTHMPSLADLRDPELAAELVLLCGEVARRQRIEESGYRVITNAGRDSGQSVDHLHFHVIGGRRLGLNVE